MRSIIIIFTWFLPMCVLAKEKPTIYHNAVDFVACLCINDTEGIEQKECRSGEFFLISDLNYPATKGLFKEFEKLKETEVDDIVPFLSHTIFNSSDFNEISKFVLKRDSIKMNTLKSQIKDHLTQLLTAKKNVTNNATLIHDNQKRSAINYNESKDIKNEIFFSFNFWVILSTLLSLFFFILLFKLILNINKKLKVLEIKTNKNHVNIDSKVQQSVIENPQIRQRFNSLQNKIEQIEHKIDDLKIINETPNKIDLESSVAKTKRKEEDVVFYMATPSFENEFHIRSKSESFKPTQTLYKFYLDNSAEAALFEFHSDENGIYESIVAPQTYLEPVCDPQNAHNPKARNIITIEKGSAIKQGDKWIVKQKAKIKYE